MVHAQNKEYKEISFIRRYFKQLHNALHDMRIENITFFTQTGNTIVWQRTLSAVHVKDFKTIKASQQKLVWNEMIVSEYKGGKIFNEWIVSELLEQLLLKSIAD